MFLFAIIGDGIPIGRIWLIWIIYWWNTLNVCINSDDFECFALKMCNHGIGVWRYWWIQFCWILSKIWKVIYSHALGTLEGWSLKLNMQDIGPLNTVYASIGKRRKSTVENTSRIKIWCMLWGDNRFFFSLWIIRMHPFWCEFTTKVNYPKQSLKR